MSVDDPESLTRNFYWRRTVQTKDSQTVLDAMANSVGWQSYRSQLGVFTMLTAFEDFDWTALTSVLEVGCGYGQLAAFLRRNKKFAGDYTGIDILSGCIKKARGLYGADRRNAFVAADFLRWPWRASRFDLVVVGGAISINYDYPERQGQRSLRYADDIIGLAAGLARRAVSIYFPQLRDVAPATDNDADMAFYPQQQIEGMLKKACAGRLVDLTIRHGSEPTDIKAAALAVLANSP